MQQFNNERPLDRHTQSNWSHFMVIFKRCSCRWSLLHLISATIWHYAVTQQILRCRTLWLRYVAMNIVQQITTTTNHAYSVSILGFQHRKGVRFSCRISVDDDIDEIYNGERYILNEFRWIFAHLGMNACPCPFVRCCCQARYESMAIIMIRFVVCC